MPEGSVADATKTETAAPAAEAVKVAETAKVDAAPAAVVDSKPVDIVLALPKDAAIDQAKLDDIAAYAKSHGLSQKQAEAQVARENAAVAGVTARNESLLAEAKAAWDAEVKADKDLAGADGAKLVVTKEQCDKALTKLEAGIPGVRQFINDSHFAGHPMVLRILRFVAQADAEDSAAHSITNHAAVARDPADVLYGKK